MTADELRTSYEWIIDSIFVELNIIDPSGWQAGDDDYEYSFYKERVTRVEFERRVMNSSIEWVHPKV